MLYLKERNNLLEAKTKSAIIIGKLEDKTVPTLNCEMEDTLQMESIKSTKS